MRVLLAFLLIVIVASLWETRRDRAWSALPLFVLCALVAAGLYSVVRLV